MFRRLWAISRAVPNTLAQRGTLLSNSLTTLPHPLRAPGTSCNMATRQFSALTGRDEKPLSTVAMPPKLDGWAKLTKEIVSAEATHILHMIKDTRKSSRDEEEERQRIKRRNIFFILNATPSEYIATYQSKIDSFIERGEQRARYRRHLLTLNILDFINYLALRKIISPEDYIETCKCILAFYRNYHRTYDLEPHRQHQSYHPVYGTADNRQRLYAKATMKNAAIKSAVALTGLGVALFGIKTALTAIEEEPAKAATSLKQG